jgi:hypothetical protein
MRDEAARRLLTLSPDAPGRRRVAATARAARNLLSRLMQ